jgi:putative transposase
MSRIARVVIPGIPHHIVMRGNRRQTVFFSDEDRRYYLELLKRAANKAGLTFRAFCLMRNHLHLIAVPKTEISLAAAMSAANWKYSMTINFREDWRGSLWQGRYYSCPLDHPHLIASARYIERNPIRAKIVERAEDYPWSSARAHCEGKTDVLIEASPLTEEIPDWRSFINQEEPEETIRSIRRHLVTGRPMGDEAFIEKLERMTGRALKKQKTGPKCRCAESEEAGQIELPEFSD